MKQKIDKTIERKVFPHDAATPPDNCPQCSQRLVQDFGPFHSAHPAKKSSASRKKRPRKPKKRRR